MARIQGSVAWFRDSYGFIHRKDGEPDVFCHWSGIDSPDKYKTLTAGDRVEFDIDRRIEDNKIIAVGVRRIEEAPHGTASNPVR